MIRDPRHNREMVAKSREHIVDRHMDLAEGWSVTSCIHVIALLTGELRLAEMDKTRLDRADMTQVFGECWDYTDDSS